MLADALAGNSRPQTLRSVGVRPRCGDYEEVTARLHGASVVNWLSDILTGGTSPYAIEILC
jgi:hypothetical protein